MRSGPYETTGKYVSILYFILSLNKNFFFGENSNV